MIRDRVQEYGKFLSKMVIPNIGAIIAWGIISVVFAPTGWLPSETIGSLAQPIKACLLPLLIGFTGGNIIAGTRGGVIATIATMGIIVESNVPMLVGAMIMGPLAGYIIKKFDKMIKDKIPAGFEMLVNNFSIGVLGMLLAIIGLLIVGPAIEIVSNFLKTGVEIIVSKGLLSLVAIFIEPAKVLFLNNAINYGIIGPIGIEQAQEIGKSIMYLLESNPGPGLGVILAYWAYGKGTTKSCAPGAAIIQTLGGIHEVYFPYILVNPLLIIAAIAGSTVSILIFSILNLGLVSPASPGSIFAIMALSEKGDILGVLIGIIAGVAVSFIVAAPLVKRNNKKIDDCNTVEACEESNIVDYNNRDINKIVFACDVGMGSSAMGATMFRKRIENLELNINVVNSSVDSIPSDADLVVTHVKLAEGVKKGAPKARYVFINNFLDDNKIDNLYFELEDISNNKDYKSKIEVDEKLNNEIDEMQVLKNNNILLGLESESKEDAIRRAGNLLVKEGYVKSGYINAMIDRESKMPTYIGMGIALPHGTEEGKDEIIKSGVVILQYPNGVTFGHELVYLIIGIAADKDEHLNIISSIATSLEDVEKIELSKYTDIKEDILEAFNI